MDAISFYSFSIQLTVLIVSTEFDANLIAFVQTMIANSGYLITVSCTRCKSMMNVFAFADKKNESVPKMNGAQGHQINETRPIDRFELIGQDND
ncbi:hypothetical protein BLOT_000835 [Blomia tropicalis]|nr:hypothetical protein BLOT_000835 [Blomia tropicalis]